jgi:hypothetical protein
MRSERIARTHDGLGLLAFPPPFRAWVAISNDPDGTTMREWEQVHRLLWEDLRLPLADSFFLFNHSERYPDQVCVERNPEILGAHDHDTMHTWGDYCDTRSHLFTRDDAERGLALLREHRLTPRVWTDHASFAGNLLHNASVPAEPVLRDRAGRDCENFAYTLDLIQDAGVRYVWDGALTRFVGQDRPLGRREWYAAPSSPSKHPRLWSVADVLAGPLWRAVDARAFDYDAGGNTQYARHRFADGRELYRFRRYGYWQLADIDALGRLLDGSTLTELVRRGGTMVVYTHLGKASRTEPSRGAHVPPHTETALRDLTARYRDGEVAVSSVSRLLDYLVLRDSCELRAGRVDFRADGVRFKELTAADLRGFELGLTGDAGSIEVTCEGLHVAADVSSRGDRVWHVRVLGEA